jgi:hypothetical protein
LALPQSGWDELNTCVQKLWMEELQDGVLSQRPFLDRVRKRRGKKFSGGTQLVIPQQYIAGQSGDYAGMEELGVNDQDEMAPAILDWKQSYSWTTVSGIEEAVSMGSSRKVIDFVANKVKIARNALIDRLNTNLFSANAAADKGATGLRNWITASGTCAGIPRATNTWWNAQVDLATTVLTPRALTSLWNLCGTNSANEFPSVHVTTSALWQIYHSVVLPFDRIADPNVAGLGFGGLTFMGKPVIWDPACPAYSWYMINEDHFHVYEHENRPMVKFTGWREPLRQDGRVGYFLWLGQFVVDSPRTCGVMTAVTS